MLFTGHLLRRLKSLKNVKVVWVCLQSCNVLYKIKLFIVTFFGTLSEVLLLSVLASLDLREDICRWLCNATVAVGFCNGDIAGERVLWIAVPTVS